MVERSLSMREALGSIPWFATFSYTASSFSAGKDLSKGKRGEWQSARFACERHWDQYPGSPLFPHLPKLPLSPPCFRAFVFAEWRTSVLVKGRVVSRWVDIERRLKARSVI